MKPRPAQPPEIRYGIRRKPTPRGRKKPAPRESFSLPLTHGKAGPGTPATWERFLPLLGLAAAAFLGSCESPSSPGARPHPRTYGPYGPRIIQDSVAPPPHRLPRHEYPFDSQGNYISSWAR